MRVQYGEEYHSPIGWSVTSFTVVRDEKLAVFAAAACGRKWPEAAFVVLTDLVANGWKADTALPPSIGRD